MRQTTVDEDQAAERAKIRWTTDQAFRNDFGSLDAAVAFARAEARGAVKIAGGGTVRVSSNGAAPAANPAPAPAGSQGRREAALRACWEDNVNGARDTYATPEDYIDAVLKGKAR